MRRLLPIFVALLLSSDFWHLNSRAQDLPTYEDFRRVDRLRRMTGQLQTAPGGEADQAMTVTRAALRAAGFPVPEPAAPGTPHAPGQAPPVPTAAGNPDGERQRDQGDRALIAHLERALEEARERELRLLDLLAHLTGQRSAPRRRLPQRPRRPPPRRPGRP